MTQAIMLWCSALSVALHGLPTPPAYRYPKESDDETTAQHAERLGMAIMRTYARPRLATELPPKAGSVTDFVVWSRAGRRIVYRDVYNGVTPGTRPSEAYDEKTLGISRRQIALAGYRLAALLERIL